LNREAILPLSSAGKREKSANLTNSKAKIRNGGEADGSVHSDEKKTSQLGTRGKENQKKPQGWGACRILRQGEKDAYLREGEENGLTE